jgi:hypothetical protein
VRLQRHTVWRRLLFDAWLMSLSVSDPPSLIEGLKIGFPLSFADGGVLSYRLNTYVIYCRLLTLLVFRRLDRS